ncbi:MAG: hypothetical protein SVN78_04370 [Deferribacterota bacterium]|nr:hypothetical protein [Deferribacterota bacterium]
MNKSDILTELENLSSKLSVKIVYANTGLKGGLCRIYNDYYIFLDRKSNLDYKVSIICEALKKFDLSNIYITPKIRKIIENDNE